MRGGSICIKNEGKGAHGAICTGFRRSTAPAVVVYPADDDYNPGVLDLMFQKWKDEALRDRGRQPLHSGRLHGGLPLAESDARPLRGFFPLSSCRPADA